MYAIAMGILIIVALYGTTKHFQFQASTGMYKTELYYASITVQRLNTMFHQERAYSIEKSILYTMAYGGYSYKDLIPVTNATVCGCKSGYSDKGGICVNNTDSNDAYFPVCYVDRNGNKLNIADLPKDYYNTVLEKKVIYWVNGSNENIPDEDYIKESIKMYITDLFAKPDPLLSVVLSAFSTGFPRFQYKAEVHSIGDKVVVEWIPLGVTKIILTYPDPVNPVLTYTISLGIKNVVYIPIDELYSKGRSFAMGGYSDILSNPTDGPLPTIIDEFYVKKYQGVDGTRNCNFSLSDTPFGNGMCSFDNVEFQKLGPLGALVYYYQEEDREAWVNAGCNDYSSDDFEALSQVSATEPICVAEIHPELSNGKIVLQIKGFSGWCSGSGTQYEMVRCVMKVTVKELEKKMNNFLNDKEYIVKTLPLEDFNLTLDQNLTESKDWTRKKFEKNYTVDFCYENRGIKNDDYKAFADSYCEIKGFKYAGKVYNSTPGPCRELEYNITKGPEVTATVENVTSLIFCNNSQTYNVSDSYGNKFNVSVSLKENCYGRSYKVSEIPLSVLARSDDLSALSKLDLICKAIYGNNSYMDYVTFKYCPSSLTGYKISWVEVVKGKENDNANGYIDWINCTDGTNYYKRELEFNWSANYDSTGIYTPNDSVVHRNLLDVACKVKCTHTSNTVSCSYNGEMYAYKVHFVKNSSAKKYDPLLNYTMKEKNYDGLIISGIHCHDKSVSYDLSSLDFEYINGTHPVMFSAHLFPKEFVNVYQPYNYANQEEILNRICKLHGAKLSWLYVTSGSNANLLWDFGNWSETGIPLCYGGNCYKSIITCVME